MRQTKIFSMGDKHYRWNMNCEIIQKYQLCKYILTDGNDDQRIETNFITPATAKELDKLIDEITYNPVSLENLHDVFSELQKRFLGNLFFEIN